MKPIILASASPRRKHLLEKLGLEFQVAPSNYEEDMKSKLKPPELAKTLSRGKAESVAAQYKNHVIIAADTFIALKDSLLGKPSNEADAVKMLKKISGKSVSVITGLTIIDTPSNKKLSKVTETKVSIKKLTEGEIKGYVKTQEPLGKAGAFAIQGKGAIIVKKIDGDFFNVMGLSLFDLSEALKKFGIYILGQPTS